MPSIAVIARSDNWWNSKIPPVFGLAFGAALIYGVSANESLAYVLAILLTAMCAGAYGHLINDIFDLEADRAAGKKNVAESFKPWQRWGFVLLTLGCGFTPALLLDYSSVSVALLLAEYALPSIYSIPPLRLKERGWLGVVADASGAHVVPCLFVISLFAFAPSAEWDAGSMEPLLYPLTAVFWASMVGLKGIIMHELKDLQSDLSAGVETFAAQLDYERIKKLSLRLFRWEIIAFLVFAVVLSRVAPIVLPSAMIFFGMSWLKVTTAVHIYSRDKYGDLLLPIVWTSNPFYELYFPLALGIHLGLREPILFLVPALLPLLFLRNCKEALSDIKFAWSMLRTQLVWKGTLSTIDAAAVKMRKLPTGGMRIEFKKCGVKPEAVGVFRFGKPVQRGTRYNVSFRARADRARHVVAAASQSDAPWDSLGLHARVSLTPEWQKFLLQFEATQDEPFARCGIFAGGDPTAIEIGGLEMKQSGERWSGQLRAAHGKVEAALVPPADDGNGVRVEISSAGEPPWALGLYGLEIKVLTQAYCEFTLTARSDRPRKVIAGLWLNCEPMQSAGLFQEIELSTEWTTQRLGFNTPGNEEQTMVAGLWLGGDNTSVEIRKLQVQECWQGSFTVSEESGFEAASAQLTLADRENGVVRVEIDQPGGAPWQIGIYRPTLSVGEGQDLALSMILRSDIPRNVSVGLWQNRAPWESLGLFQELSLSEEWQSYDFIFAATRSDTAGRLGLWLGCEAASIEIRAMKIYGCLVSALASADADAAQIQHPGKARAVQDPWFETWELDYYLPARPVKSGERFLIELTARTDTTRKTIIGLWQNHEPWASVSSHHELKLTPEWQTFSLICAADPDDAACRLALWAPGARSAVEIREWEVFKPWNGTLGTADGASADVRQVADGSWRVSIANPGSQTWAIQLFRPCVAIRDKEQYCIRVVARADGKRTAVLGAWQCHEPWASIDATQEVQLDTEWRTFKLTITSQADDVGVCCGLWLGGDATSVEVQELTMAFPESVLVELEE